MGQVVLGKRLRDQVYDLIREDLLKGALPTNERFFEVDLAAKYRVSRTPVREALFQLTREGLLISEERGYTLPVDNAKSVADRIEVHLLLDPKVAASAAANRTPEQTKQMAKALERATKAHKSGNYSAYVDAAHAFRVLLRSMCDNEPLRRCAMLIEDQFLAARNALFKDQKNRALDLTYNNKILAAIESGEPKVAETTARNYYQELRDLNLLKSEK